MQPANSPRESRLLTRLVTAALLVGLPVTARAAAPAGDTRLGVKGTAFTIDDRPTFLLGASYYGALAASDDTIRQDLDELQRRGFNWIRVWATWGAFGNEVSAVDGQGNAREPFLEKLRRLVAECGRRGMVVDVTLSRGNGITGPPRLQTLTSHRRAVETVVAVLVARPNWYLDLSNERDRRGPAYASFAELRELRAAVRRLDPRRLVTASHAGDISREEVGEYLRTVGVDFLAPHRPRHAGSPLETKKTTLQLLAWTKDFGREMPVHYQEPFRRGFSDQWNPSAEDFATDLGAALAGGAAGWCFHNGDQRSRPDGRPRRSFDLRTPLFEQLDDQERTFLDHRLAEALKKRMSTAASSAADAKVTGWVTLDGRRLAAGKIAFHQKNGQFVGVKFKNGEFRVDRVPVGKLRVSIEGKGVPGRYASEDSSHLWMTVSEDESNNIAEFMLTTRDPQGHSP